MGIFIRRSMAGRSKDGRIEMQSVNKSQSRNSPTVPATPSLGPAKGTGVAKPVDRDVSIAYDYVQFDEVSSVLRRSSA